MRRSKSIFPGLCALAVLSLHCAAQTAPNATVTGQILDPGGASIVGAQIEARQLGGSFAIRLISDQSGRFAISNLPAGWYEFHVEHTGFRDLRQQVQVQDGNSTSLNFPLAVSSINESVTVSAQSSLVTEAPVSQTQASVSREDFKNSPAMTVADVLGLAPGVTFVQGNGPRDISLSVRGSNTRQTFGVRNVQVFEDGFPVTQPDGLARTDLTDPHAYGSVEVVQGPSSALYGNYATGGAINFHTRSGSEIQGA